MTEMILRLKLKSAATFGRGDSVPGLVDREIEHDSDGFPYLRGRTLKGLLVESAENVVYALEQQQHENGWHAAREQLFGQPGRGLRERGILHVGDARLPKSLRILIQIERANRNGEPTPDQVLSSLTAIRRQTAMNPEGGPDHHTLRALRILLCSVVLEARLRFTRPPTDLEKALLAAAVLDFRRAGTGRNRGRGWVQAELDNEATTRELFDQFVEAVQP